MSAPIVYRSTDSGAPPMIGAPETLIELLDFCLRRGYGGKSATGTITSDGTNVTAGETVTVGSIVYTFQTVVSAAYDVLVGANASASFANLSNAINETGVMGTTYGTGTVRNPDATVVIWTSTVMTLQARLPGTEGNSVALAETSAHLTVSGANFTGGTQGKATGTLTSTGTNPANNDTATIGSTVYTFKTALASAYDVLIGVDAATTLGNLKAAINKEAGEGTLYGTGTVAHPSVTAGTVTGTPALPVTAIKWGPAQNSVATTEASAQLSWGATTLTGGAGKDPAGWTKPFTGTRIAVFRQGAGNQFYFRVNDNGPGAGTYKEARIRGWEVKADANDVVDASNTGPFPTIAQLANGNIARKSTGVDSTTRDWYVIADDRTVYVFIKPEVAAGAAGGYSAFMFGDIYSYQSADGYRTGIIGRATENVAFATNDVLHQITSGGYITLSGHYLARAYTGAGGSLAFGKHGDASVLGAFTGGLAVNLRGIIPLPNTADGGFYIAPVYVMDSSATIRGKLRGFWHWGHAANTAVVADGDTWTAPASSPWSGRSFLLIKNTDTTGTDTTSGAFVIETTAWDTSS